MLAAQRVAKGDQGQPRATTRSTHALLRVAGGVLGSGWRDTITHAFVCMLGPRGWVVKDRKSWALRCGEATVVFLYPIGCNNPCNRQCNLLSPASCVRPWECRTGLMLFSMPVLAALLAAPASLPPLQSLPLPPFPSGPGASAWCCYCCGRTRAVAAAGSRDGAAVGPVAHWAGA